jgi:hypothetical protein
MAEKIRSFSNSFFNGCVCLENVGLENGWLAGIQRGRAKKYFHF